MYALLVRLTFREDVADDLLQELVIRLSQSAGFQETGDSLRYAKRAAVHLAFDWLRRKRREGNIAEFQETSAPTAETSLEAIITHEDYDRVLQHIERLPTLSRTCVVLHYIERLSYSEIAKELSKTPHQVRGLCHKGIRRLQRSLGVPVRASEEKGECS